MKQDMLTGAEIAFEGDHGYIHSGLAFSTPIVIPALAAAGVSNIGFTTPARGLDHPQIHWRPTEFSSTANSVRLRLYQGSAFTSGTLNIPRNRNQYFSEKADRSVANPKMLVYSGVTSALGNTLAVTTKAGGGFANQPAGDGLEIVSDDAADIGMQVTIYGTITGTTTTVTSETITLSGTTAVSTAVLTWVNILGVEMDSVAAGTVTIREASTNATVITLATTVLSAGIETPTITNWYNELVRRDASGASTSPVGIIGTYYDDSAKTTVGALDGTTEGNLSAVPFKTVSKVLIGAVAANVNVSILRPDHIVDTYSVGSGGASNRGGGTGRASQEIVLEPNTSYVLNVVNTGASTATDIDLNVFYYEETY
jgi:hypothetical protein